MSDPSDVMGQVFLHEELGRTCEALFLQIDKDPQFIANRKKSYLRKIISSHIFFRQSLLGEKDYILRLFRQKFYKVQSLQTASSKILGICFAFTFFNENEKFGYKHLSGALKRLIPGIRVIEDSYYFCKFSQENILFCYVEIEKIRGKHLSLEETFHLKKTLPKEIEDSIESSYSPLFIPSNEEEIYKNIATLSKEVNNISSLPHVMISFVKQESTTLHFNVALVRLLPIGKPAFPNVAPIIPLKLRIYINKTSITPKNIVKEICVFSVEIPLSQFYRKNYSIHFLNSRKYISHILEGYIGEFRDFNGGLLIKQSEQLGLIAESIEHKVDNFSIIEEFFLSLIPSDIQTLITPKVALSLYYLYKKVKGKDSTSLYMMEYLESKDALIILVKTTQEKVESLLYTVAFEEIVLTGYAKLVIGKQTYFCFIQINPSDLSFFLKLQTSLEDLEKREKKTIPDTLKIPFQESLPPSLHPYLATDTNSTTVCKALYEGLTRITPEGKVELALAKKIEVSPCQKKYTITLKPTRWSNGEPLLAEDFIKAWEKAISPSTKCLRYNLLFLLRNAEKVHKNILPMKSLGVRVLEQYKIFIELEHPAPYFIQLLADPLYSPLYDESDQEPEIFNGPYKFDSQEKNKEMHLIKNPLYWDHKKVKIQKIHLLLVKKFSTMLDMFYKNQLDWVGSPFGDLVDEPKQYFSSFKTKNVEVPYWLYCNTKNPKLRSAKIRRALSLAIDRSKIGEKILSHQQPTSRIIPKGLSFFELLDPIEKKNLRKAKKLWKEGLKEEGLNPKKFTLTISYSSNTNFQESLAHFLKKSWEKAFGIKVFLQGEEWDVHTNNLFNEEYEIGGACKFPTCLEPIYFLETFLSIPANYSKWENKEFQKWVSLAKKEPSLEKRKIYIAKAEEILQEHMPVIPIYNRTHLYLCNPYLHNLSPPELAYTDFKYCYFNKRIVHE